MIESRECLTKILISLLCKLHPIECAHQYTLDQLTQYIDGIFSTNSVKDFTTLSGYLKQLNVF